MTQEKFKKIVLYHLKLAHMEQHLKSLIKY